MDAIIEYYKLCSVVPESERLLPLVNYIEHDIVDIIFTKRDVKRFLEERDGVYVLRENVIGAGDDSGDDSDNDNDSVNTQKNKSAHGGTILVFV